MLEPVLLDQVRVVADQQQTDWATATLDDRVGGQRGRERDESNGAWLSGLLVEGGCNRLPDAKR